VVVEQFFPLRIPAVEVDLLVDAVDQRFLVRKVAIQERLGDAQPLREFPGAAAEAGLAEKRDRPSSDGSLAFIGGKARTRRLGLRGRHAVLIWR